MRDDEQLVRTMAGWIGVEISRSRVRTPGRAGHGLYRVRGSVGRCWHEARELPQAARTEDGHGERGPWTEYAFTLDEIGRSVSCAISLGTPAGPADMQVCPAIGGQLVVVPTRWTQAYRGKRNLGEVPERVNVPCEPGFDPSQVSICSPCRCVSERDTTQTRQRTANNAFQAEHLERRAYGLERRHAAKLRRNEPGREGTAR